MPVKRMGRPPCGLVWNSAPIALDTVSDRWKIRELMRRLRDDDIPLEICITSNVYTGAVASLDAHPVKRLYDAGVPITINTDDPALFRTSLEAEYAIARDRFGIPTEVVKNNSLRYATRLSSDEFVERFRVPFLLPTNGPERTIPDSGADVL